MFEKQLKRLIVSRFLNRHVINYVIRIIYEGNAQTRVN